MPTTPIYGIRYPSLIGVTPDVPRDLKNATEDIETVIDTERAARAAGDRVRIWEGVLSNEEGVVAGVALNWAWPPLWNTVPTSTITPVWNDRTFVIQETGIYHLEFSVVWAAMASPVGVRRAMIWQNPTSNASPPVGTPNPVGGNSLTLEQQAPVAGWPTYLYTSTVTRLTAGTRLLFVTLQTAGGTNDVTVNQNHLNRRGSAMSAAVALLGSA